MKSLKTYFASAERATLAEVKRQAELLQSQVSCRVLDMVQDMVLVLNKERQVVYANRALIQALNLPSMEAAQGERPGELLKCIHVVSAPGGCGTSEACSVCGAMGAIFQGLEGKNTEQECRITTLDQGSDTALELKVTSEFMKVKGEVFVALALHDISNEKRRQTLERLFLHDILNSAGGLHNLMELLAEEAPEGIEQEMTIARDMFSGMVEEIKGQRAILDAETGVLRSRPAPHESLELLRGVVQRFSRHKAVAGHVLEVEDDSLSVNLQVDENLLGRVLGNMVVNALEATPPGGRVTLACREQDGQAVFSVHNPGSMPQDVQMQVFQRSFSTKGSGRGLGTYSIRLLATRYLGGKAWFSSDPEQGTSFFVSLPLAAR